MPLDQLRASQGKHGFLDEHSLIHYHAAIQAFSAPNGLCFSVTESKHFFVIKNLY